jgi:hypothetical protein
MAKAPQAGALISLRLRPHGAVLRHRELCPAARRGVPNRPTCRSSNSRFGCRAEHRD